MEHLPDKSPLHQLADEINREHEACRVKFKESLLHARRCGELLIRAKESCGHGQWLPWLKAHTAVAERTAQAYMKVSRDWAQLESKSATVADFTLKGALELLASGDSPQRTTPLDKMIGNWKDLGERWYDQSIFGTLVLDAIGKPEGEIAGLLGLAEEQVKSILNPRPPKLKPQVGGDGAEEAQHIQILEEVTWGMIHSFMSRSCCWAGELADMVGEGEAATYLRSLSAYHEKQAKKHPWWVNCHDSFQTIIFNEIACDMFRHAIGGQKMELLTFWLVFGTKANNWWLVHELEQKGKLKEWHKRRGNEAREFALACGVDPKDVDRFYGDWANS